MSQILISDPHLSSRPQDKFMFMLKDVVTKAIHDYEASELYILGDVTQNKSGHNSELVNRIANIMRHWAQMVKVTILAGNHDGDTDIPFFQWLDHFPNVTFINEPRQVGEWLFLPHTRSPLEDWKDLDFTGKKIMAHVPVKGAIYENGVRAEEGLDPAIFNSAKLVFSGDIHSRQSVGPVNYVGAPYRIRFNDRYLGGGILIKDDKWDYITFPEFPLRITYDVGSHAEFGAIAEKNRSQFIGHPDQIKVRLHLDTGDNTKHWRAELEAIKEIAQEKGLDLCGGLEIINSNTWTDHVSPDNLDKRERSLSFGEWTVSRNFPKELINFGEAVIKEVG
jgi:Calcineurin-like phosphoesterase